MGRWVFHWGLPRSHFLRTKGTLTPPENGENPKGANFQLHGNWPYPIISDDFLITPPINRVRIGTLRDHRFSPRPPISGYRYVRIFLTGSTVRPCSRRARPVFSMGNELRLPGRLVGRPTYCDILSIFCHRRRRLVTVNWFYIR